MVKVSNKDTRTTPLTLTLNMFYTFSRVSILKFDQVNATWVKSS